MGWLVHGGTRAAVLCPRPTHEALETWGEDPGSEPALPGVGGHSRDHCAQPPGTSSHPVGTGSPPKCQLGCSSPPTGNASVDHWLSLPGRPREGWSGAARTPGTPWTPRTCRLRVGAGRKDLSGWAHALPGPPGLVAVIRASSPPPWNNPQRHEVPFC